jgi:hypothetical protein
MQITKINMLDNRVTTVQDNKGNNIPFTSLITLTLKDAKKAPQIAEEIIKAFGEGLQTRTFMMGSKKYTQDIFIGVKKDIKNPDLIESIQIATGGDQVLKDEKGSSYLTAKIEQVDNVISSKLKKIVSNYDKDLKGRINVQSKTDNATNIGNITNYDNGTIYVKTGYRKWDVYDKLTAKFENSRDTAGSATI